MNDIKFYKIDKRAYARSARALLWLTMSVIVVFLVWSAFASLDEVAIGQGKVAPSSKEKIIQSLEAGILTELSVREGDIVEEGQKLATLHAAQAQSSVDEATARIASLQARAARLTAEMNEKTEVTFPSDLHDQALIDRERELFLTNRRAFKENVKNLDEQLTLAKKELQLAIPLLKTGAANEVEVLRLRQKVAELNTRLEATRSEYVVGLKTEFSKTMAEIYPLVKVREGRADQLARTVLTSPSRGIVKDIRVNTIGGVVSAGGVLMEIVPLDDKLLIEARLSPRDIAFIHPGQDANVKITAYEPSIYGSLTAKVDRISPDTIEDEVDRRVYYYRAYVLTDYSYLETKDGRRHPILPGMIATTEIRTGKRTVLEYLIKPLNRAGEALRER